MKLTKCSNGHFYDGDKYTECPYCNTDLRKDAGIVQQTQGTEDSKQAPLAAPQPAGPVTGWLVVMSGARRGTDYRLEEGRNFFGMDADGSPVALSADAPLSARLLVVAYDAATGTFCMLPGSGRELAYLNGKANLAEQPLSPGDEITLGKATIQFVPFCGSFRWENTASAKEQPAHSKPAAKAAPAKKAAPATKATPEAKTAPAAKAEPAAKK